MKKIILAVLFLTTFLKSFALDIKGTVSDSLTRESLIGATIFLKPVGTGTITAVDGSFQLTNIKPGKYIVEVNYLGYVKEIIPVQLLSDTIINFVLRPSSMSLTEVVVKTKASKETTSEQVRQQEKSAVVQDGVSNETMKKTPDSKASDAFKRISGASVQDNKFVVIRGLSDRYNFALINGVPLPSSESDRRAFSFDIFPTNMLDGLVIMKTASPDLPGEFSGGVINITTSETKDQKFQYLQFGLGFNSISTFKRFYTYSGSPTDFLGFGVNSRKLNEGVPTTQDYGLLNKSDKAELAKLMSNNWSVSKRMALPVGNFQYSIGKEFQVAKRDLGFVFSYNYQNSENFAQTIRRDFEEQATEVVKKMELRDSVFTKTILNSAMLNLQYEVNDKTTIKFKNLYSINSEDKVNIRNGVRELDNDPRQWEKSTNFWYTQNNLLTQQLNGKHKIGESQLNWNLGFSDVKREIPNLRRIVYRKYSLLEDDTTQKWVAVVQTNGTIPTSAGNMFWSTSAEKIWSANYDWQVPVNFSKVENLIKVGGWQQLRTRQFTSRNLGFSQYKPTGSSFNSDLLLLSPDKIFSQENMGLLSNGQGGFKLEEATNVDDNYTASSFLNAGYLMTDSKIGEKLRLIGGLRVESYNQKFNYIEFGSNQEKRIDTTVVDFLPSINSIYQITKKMKLRASYSRTVSRPEFRELAPFSFYNFVIDNIISGNPNLKRATIDNYDLRWEMYPGKGQVLSVSGFYKNFTNPIELINRTGTSGAPELFFSNVESSKNFGAELEVRLNLGTISKSESKLLDCFTFYTNASLIKSTVNLTNFVGSGGIRPLQGQSPYIINTGLFFNTPDKKTTATVSYNLIGPRIYIVGNIQEPSVWENGRNVIDFQVSHKFNKHLEARLNIKDILAQDLIYFQDLNGNKKYDKVSDNNWQEINFGQTISASLKWNF